MRQAPNPIPILQGLSVDGRNPAPPKKPWKDDSPVHGSNQWLPMVPSGVIFRPSSMALETLPVRNPRAY